MARPTTANYSDWFWALVVCSILLRLLISPGLLNLFENYSLKAGSVLEKFHPGTYLLIFSIVFAAVARPQQLKIDRTMAWAGGVLLVGTAIALVNARLNIAATTVDTLVVSMILGNFVIFAEPRRRERLCRLLGGILCLHGGLIFGEFIAKQTLVPNIRVDEIFFRPQGLLDHPLTAGYASLAAIAWLVQSSLTPAARMFGAVTLLIQIALCGVRLPLILGVAIVLQHVFFSRQIVTHGLMIARVAIILVFPFVLYGLYSVGALDRMVNMGIGTDESSISRLESLRILDFMQGSVFWTGLSNDDIDAYLEIMKLPILENSFAAYAISAGLVATACFCVYIVLLAFRVVPRTFPFMIVFVGALAGSISFSTKTQFVPLFVVFCLGARDSLIMRRLRPQPAEFSRPWQAHQAGST
jgi:hypothetical protein